MNRIALASLALVASLGSAQAYDSIDARQAQQARRIEEGRRTGQLSGREYNVLKAEQARIAADERRARADGYVSPQERARLDRELDDASRHIRDLKHNREVAGGGYGGGYGNGYGEGHRRWYRRWW